MFFWHELIPTQAAGDESGSSAAADVGIDLNDHGVVLAELARVRAELAKERAKGKQPMQ